MLESLHENDLKFNNMSGASLSYLLQLRQPFALRNR